MRLYPDYQLPLPLAFPPCNSLLALDCTIVGTLGSVGVAGRLNKERKGGSTDSFWIQRGR